MGVGFPLLKKITDHVIASSPGIKLPFPAT
jgi:hypothetical protein